MQTHWILDALADLTRYAEDHDMDELARRLQDAHDSVATTEPETNQDGSSRFRGGLGAPRRLH